MALYEKMDKECLTDGLDHEHRRCNTTKLKVICRAADVELAASREAAEVIAKSHLEAMWRTAELQKIVAIQRKALQTWKDSERYRVQYQHLPDAQEDVAGACQQAERLRDEALAIETLLPLRSGVKMFIDPRPEEITDAHLYEWLRANASVEWTLSYDSIEIRFPLDSEKISSFDDLDDAIRQAISVQNGRQPI